MYDMCWCGRYPCMHATKRGGRAPSCRGGPSSLLEGRLPPCTFRCNVKWKETIRCTSRCLMPNEKTALSAHHAKLLQWVNIHRTFQHTLAARCCPSPSRPLVCMPTVHGLRGRSRSPSHLAARLCRRRTAAQISTRRSCNTTPLTLPSRPPPCTKSQRRSLQKRAAEAAPKRRRRSAARARRQRLALNRTQGPCRCGGSKSSRTRRR